MPGPDQSQAARLIAALARAALGAEARITPKPGLVDGDNNGAHRDLNFGLFLKSAAALQPYFFRCALLGWPGGEPRAVFAALRAEGLKAERRMLAVTAGANTHKGAIFSLGLLAAASALAVRRHSGLDLVEARVQRLSQGLVERDLAGRSPGPAATAGERAFQAWRISGARGQAEAGFPQVIRGALPRLEKLVAQGRSFNLAGMETLIWLMAEVEDTNLLARGGREGLSFAAGRARALCADGRAADPAAVRELDREFISRNLSPGGCADLLAATFFLFFLRGKGLMVS